jgi:hypothetical protein
MALCSYNRALMACFYWIYKYTIEISFSILLFYNILLFTYEPKFVVIGTNCSFGTLDSHIILCVIRFR